MTKNFLFLLGTQKAGTTYTHLMLKDHPQFFDGGLKEMRFWRNFFINEKVKKKIIENFRKVKRKNSNIRADNLQINDFSNYFKRYSMCQKYKKIKCVADMTPANGTLTEEQLLIAYKAIKNNGYKIKPIYLMRDPIERLWSQAKMNYFNKVIKKNIKNLDKSQLFDFFLNLSRQDYLLQDNIGRTRYDLIIPKIEKVLNQEKIFYYFSEDMRGETFKFELFKFLEIDQFFFPNKENSGYPTDIKISTNEIPKDYFEQVLKIFKPVYLFVSNKFKEKTPKIWQTRIEKI